MDRDRSTDRSPNRPLSARDRILLAVAPLAALLTAAVGTWHHHHDLQPAWQGGTLGMFSMVDSQSNRILRGVAVDPGDPTEAPIFLRPVDVDTQVRTLARIRPTHANLAALAEAWIPALDTVELVRVEVWAMRFDGHGPAVRLELIGSYQVGSR